MPNELSRRYIGCILQFLVPFGLMLAAWVGVSHIFATHQIGSNWRDAAQLADLINAFTIGTVGLYIAAHLVAEMLSHQEAWRTFPICVFGAVLSGWMIVAGPVYGWLLLAAILVLFSTLVIPPIGLIVAFALGPILGPLLAGIFTGTLAWLASWALVGRNIGAPEERLSRWMHILGFTVAAFLIFKAASHLDHDLSHLYNANANGSAYASRLGTFFLALPLTHGVLVTVARMSGRWPEGKVYAPRVALLTMALFLIIGLARTCATADFYRLATWPWHDIKSKQLMFWYGARQYDAPVTIGGYTFTGLPRHAYASRRADGTYFSLEIPLDRLVGEGEKQTRLLFVIEPTRNRFLSDAYCIEPWKEGFLQCKVSGLGDAPPDEYRYRVSVPAGWPYPLAHGSNAERLVLIHADRPRIGYMYTQWQRKWQSNEMQMWSLADYEWSRLPGLHVSVRADGMDPIKLDPLIEILDAQVAAYVRGLPKESPLSNQ